MIYLSFAATFRGLPERGPLLVEDALSLAVKEGHDKCHGLSLKKPDDGLRLHVLDSRRFLCGYLFYEYRRRRPLNASSSLLCRNRASIAASAL